MLVKTFCINHPAFAMIAEESCIHLALCPECHEKKRIARLQENLRREKEMEEMQRMYALEIERKIVESKKHSGQLATRPHALTSECTNRCVGLKK